MRFSPAELLLQENWCRVRVGVSERATVLCSHTGAGQGGWDLPIAKGVLLIGRRWRGDEWHWQIWNFEAAVH